MYIGNIPAENYASFLTQTFSVTATASYTLDHAVSNENDIRLVINNVVQQPGSGKAYTASGTTLTLSEATASTDVMYCVYLGRALQTVNPPNASVGTSQLASSLDLSSKTVTLASNMTNAPAFEAHLSSSQALTDNALTKVEFDNEIFDTDNAYDNSTNYRFTPTVAGKYYVYASLCGSTSDYKLYFSIPKIYKNGSEIANISNTFGDGAVYAVDSFVAVVADMNGSSDYLEFFGIIDIHQNLNESFLGGSMSKTAFGAYKIIE